MYSPVHKTVTPSPWNHGPVFVQLLLISDPNFWFCGSALISVSGSCIWTWDFTLCSCQVLTAIATHLALGTRICLTGLPPPNHWWNPALVTKRAAASDKSSFNKNVSHQQTGVCSSWRHECQRRILKDNSRENRSCPYLECKEDGKIYEVIGDRQEAVRNWGKIIFPLGFLRGWDQQAVEKN